MTRTMQVLVNSDGFIGLAADQAAGTWSNRGSPRRQVSDREDRHWEYQFAMVRRRLGTRVHLVQQLRW